MIEILKIKGSWSEVLDDCRATVKKAMRGKDPSPKWKRKILIAEHDPVRDIEVKFRMDLPYWVAMHFKTHIWRSRCNSQRNDRQAEYDRTKAPQDAPVELIGDCNAQHLIDTSRKRLCRQASPETRHAWEQLKIVLHEAEPEIADAMVPNCVYRCGCPELLQQPGHECYFYRNMIQNYPAMASTDIQERYDAYNAYFDRIIRKAREVEQNAD